MGQETKPEKSILKRIAKVALITFTTLFTLIVIIFVIPKILNIFWGKDIPPINDQDMQLNVINIPEEENGFYDMDKIKDFINIKNIPKGIKTNDIGSYLKSDEWDKEVVENLLNDNKSAFQYFDSAAKKGKFQSPVTAYPDKISFNMPVVVMSDWRQIARLSTVKAIWLAKDGETEKAIEEAFKSIIIGDAIERSQCNPITYLVGISIKDIGFDILQKIIFLSKINRDNLIKYKEKLKKYNLSDNDSQFKIEYFSSKKAALIIKNDFYFKPNLTISYNYQFFKDMILEFKNSCDSEKIVQPVIQLENKSFIIDIVKYYFTENVVGKALHGLLATSYNAIKIKKCEIRKKFDFLLKL